MSDVPAEVVCLLLAAAFCGVSAVAIWRQVRQGSMVGIKGGLHVNIALFYGLGMATYPIAPPQERIGDVIGAMNRAAWLNSPAPKGFPVPLP